VILKVERKITALRGGKPERMVYLDYYSRKEQQAT
jgi:hypothetical protein